MNVPESYSRALEQGSLTVAVSETERRWEGGSRNEIETRVGREDYLSREKGTLSIPFCL